MLHPICLPGSLYPFSGSQIIHPETAFSFSWGQHVRWNWAWFPSLVLVYPGSCELWCRAKNPWLPPWSPCLAGYGFQPTPQVFYGPWLSPVSFDLRKRSGGYIQHWFQLLTTSIRLGRFYHDGKFASRHWAVFFSISPTWPTPYWACTIQSPFANVLCWTSIKHLLLYFQSLPAISLACSGPFLVAPDCFFLLHPSLFAFGNKPASFADFTENLAANDSFSKPTQQFILWFPFS